MLAAQHARDFGHALLALHGRYGARGTGCAALLGHDQVMVDHCRWSQAGLYYRDYAEFALALHALRADRALRKRLGANGRRYVDANYRWERIEALFEGALRAAASL